MNRRKFLRNMGLVSVAPILPATFSNEVMQTPYVEGKQFLDVWLKDARIVASDLLMQEQMKDPRALFDVMMYRFYYAQVLEARRTNRTLRLICETTDLYIDDAGREKVNAPISYMYMSDQIIVVSPDRKYIERYVKSGE